MLNGTLGGNRLSNGVVTQVMGPVVDVRFDEAQLPEINEALQVHVKATGENEEHVLTMEVALHLGAHVVRTISISGTDGLQRGSQVTSTWTTVSVPFGAETLGRGFTVFGDNMDRGVETPESVTREKIELEASKYVNLSIGREVLDASIKVVDLLAAFITGGKIGLFA